MSWETLFCSHAKYFFLEEDREIISMTELVLKGLSQVESLKFVAKDKKRFMTQKQNVVMQLSYLILWRLIAKYEKDFAVFMLSLFLRGLLIIKCFCFFYCPTTARQRKRHTRERFYCFMRRICPLLLKGIVLWVYWSIKELLSFSRNSCADRDSRIGK